MPEFRKLITALAGVTLFAGLASAQVGAFPGGGVPLGTPFTCGVQNGAVTPTLRAEGYTEDTGDIVLVCSGGSALATNTGVAIPTANITVFLNTQVTSRLLPTTTSPNASEALLLVDEPGSAVGGYGPSVPQTFCGNPNVGAGPGGCTEYVGQSTVEGSTPGTVGGVPVQTVSGPAACTATSLCAPGANVFQGVATGNQVTFFGIPVMPPATAGATRVYRIVNVRANANGVSAGGPTPGAVQASLSINSSSSIAITASTLTVGFVQSGLVTSVRNASNSGALGANGTNFAQCTSVSVTSTTNSAAALGIVRFQENFATAFKTRVSANSQNIPGTIYNSESGLVIAAINSSNNGTGGTSTAGLADYGTRLKAIFNNVPAGVNLFVTTRDVSNSFNAVGTAPIGSQAVLVVSETAPDSPTAPAANSSGLQPTITPNASQTATFGITSGTAVGIAPVAINTSTGTGVAVWEIVATNPNQIDTVDFGVFASYTANAGSNSPAPGTFTVTLSFAPTPSTVGAPFTAAAGSVASSILSIPRFADTPGPKNLATISLCTSAMLFPYVTNAGGFDTGIAIANTTADIFGTSPQAGTCSINFWGTAVPTVNPFVTTSVASGAVYATLASTISPGFTGYAIANCNFQYGHGFAFISDIGARNFAMGYLALIFTNGSNLNRSNSAAENLNN